MPDYLFSPRVEDVEPKASDQFSLSLPSDEHACDNARDWLNTSDAQRATIRVGRQTSQGAKWLGLYDYERGHEPIWLAQP